MSGRGVLWLLLVLVIVGLSFQTPAKKAQRGNKHSQYDRGRRERREGEKKVREWMDKREKEIDRNTGQQKIVSLPSVYDTKQRKWMEMKEKEERIRRLREKQRQKMIERKEMEKQEEEKVKKSERRNRGVKEGRVDFLRDKIVLQEILSTLKRVIPSHLHSFLRSEGSFLSISATTSLTTLLSQSTFISHPCFGRKESERERIHHLISVDGRLSMRVGKKKVVTEKRVQDINAVSHNPFFNKILFAGNKFELYYENSAFSFSSFLSSTPQLNSSNDASNVVWVAGGLGEPEWANEEMSNKDLLPPHCPSLLSFLSSSSPNYLPFEGAAVVDSRRFSFSLSRFFSFSNPTDFRLFHSQMGGLLEDLKSQNVSLGLFFSLFPSDYLRNGQKQNCFRIYLGKPPPENLFSNSFPLKANAPLGMCLNVGPSLSSGNTLYHSNHKTQMENTSFFLEMFYHSFIWRSRIAESRAKSSSCRRIQLQRFFGMSKT